MGEAQESVLPVIILIARPGAGKSEIINYLTSIPEDERLEKFHIGKLFVIDDFPFLWRWFEEDAILSSLGKPRLYTDNEGYFKFNYLWDILIYLINLEFEKFKKKSISNVDYTVIIEFSRGKQHGGYAHALPLIAENILSNACLMYVDVSWEESLRKNRKRFNPEKPDSILEHSLPDSKLEKLYYECDFKEISSINNSFLNVNQSSLPYVVFNNQDDVTTNNQTALVERLEVTLSNLWNLYRNINQSSK